MTAKPQNDTGAWWIARPENADKIWYGLVALCGLLIAIDVVYHSSHDKHGNFDFETAIGFHAIYGFVAFIFVVLVGKELRKVLMRSEDYYDVPYEPLIEEPHHDEHHDSVHGDGHD